MRILALTTSTNNTHTQVGSLEAAGHDVSVIRYDQRWHELAYGLIQADPNNQARIQMGQLHISRDECAMDEQILMEAKIGKPDAVVYISAWQGDFVPLNETLGELNQIAPVVHLLGDGADPPWWPQLKEFERRGTFSLTVNIDGCHEWPGGEWWHDFNYSECPPLKNALTLLTPLDTRVFAKEMCSFEERPIPILYAGNQGDMFRQAIINQLQERVGRRGFHWRERDLNPASYPDFVTFLQHSRVSISVPFTGSRTKRHVKGRVVETGFAGGCLLEWRNDATASWFDERKEVWFYDSVEECAELAEWLAAHPKIAGDTGRKLRWRCEDEHSPEVFWKTVFERLGK